MSEILWPYAEARQNMEQDFYFVNREFVRLWISTSFLHVFYACSFCIGSYSLLPQYIPNYLPHQ